MPFNPRYLWIAVGFLGQALFFGRFFVQWIASERSKQSVIPRAFWYLSLAGGSVLLMRDVGEWLVHPPPTDPTDPRDTKDRGRAAP